VRRLRIGWAMKERAEQRWWESDQKQARAPEAWLGIARRAWGRRSRAPDQVREMLGASAMNSAQPVPAEQIRRS